MIEGMSNFSMSREATASPARQQPMQILSVRVHICLPQQDVKHPNFAMNLYTTFAVHAPLLVGWYYSP